MQKLNYLIILLSVLISGCQPKLVGAKQFSSAEQARLESTSEFELLAERLESGDMKGYEKELHRLAAERSGRAIIAKCKLAGLYSVQNRNAEALKAYQDLLPVRGQISKASFQSDGTLHSRLLVCALKSGNSFLVNQIAKDASDNCVFSSPSRVSSPNFKSSSTGVVAELGMKAIALNDLEGANLLCGEAIRLRQMDAHQQLQWLAFRVRNSDFYGVSERLAALDSGLSSSDLAIKREMLASIEMFQKYNRSLSHGVRAADQASSLTGERRKHLLATGF